MTPKLARKLSHPFTHASGWLIVLLLLWNVIRGFALHMEPYGLGQYFYTYDGGFLIRGLMGTLVRWIAGPEPMAIYAFLEVFTVIEYLLFVLVLLWTFQRLRGDDPTRREFHNLLFLVLISGPLLVGIGGTRGFHDVLIMSLGLMAYLAFRSHRLLLALALVTLATLIHEQLAFFLYPALGWRVWTRARHLAPQQRLISVLPSVLALAAMCMVTLAVTELGKGSPEQLQILIDRVTEALHTPYLDRWADPYLTVLAASNNPTSNITLDNFERYIIFRGHLVMLATTVLFWMLGAWVLLQRHRLLDLFVYTIAHALPFTLLLLAYDVHRYTALSTLPSYLICVHTVKHYAVRPLPPPYIPALILVIVAQTAMWNYDPVFFNARNSTPLLEGLRTVIPPSRLPQTRVGTPHP